MLCPFCGSMNRNRAKFCRKCGKTFQKKKKLVDSEEKLIFCPACGSENKPDMDSCEVCGYPIKKPTIEPVELPPTVVEEEPPVSSESQPIQVKEEPAGEEAEKIAPVTPKPPVSPGKFCDICGFENPSHTPFCKICGSPLEESGVRGQKSEVGDQKSEVRGQKPCRRDIHVPRIVVGSQKSEVVGQKSEVGGQRRHVEVVIEEMKVKEEIPQKEPVQPRQEEVPQKEPVQPGEERPADMSPVSPKPDSIPSIKTEPSKKEVKSSPPEDSDKRFCANCGYENRAEAAFCKICGSSFEELTAAPGSDVKEPVSTRHEKILLKEETVESREISKKEMESPVKDDFSKELEYLHEMPISLQNGRYEIVKVLGAGGTGRIFLAKDTRMGIDIVLKELHPVASDPETVEYLKKRFVEEAKLLFRLNHKGFPRVVDYFTEIGRLFIIMQYIEGKNLQLLLREQHENRFELDQCIRWMDEMLQLLIVLQGYDPPIIHRDIKPANIMIDKNNVLYLVDFGFARTLDPRGSKTRVGTYGYASPEHFSGNFVISSDIFSLGATFHHLITGESPQKRKDPFSYPVISRYAPDFPGGLQKIFDKMLSLSKAFRYQNAREVKKDLDKFLEEYRKRQDFNVKD